MLSKALEIGAASIRSRFGGTWRGALFLEPLREEKKISFRGIFMMVSIDM
jgi:hypothetical protein